MAALPGFHEPKNSLIDLICDRSQVMKKTLDALNISGQLLRRAERFIGADLFW